MGTDLNKFCLYLSEAEEKEAVEIAMGLAREFNLGLNKALDLGGHKLKFQTEVQQLIIGFLTSGLLAQLEHLGATEDQRMIFLGDIFAKCLTKHPDFKKFIRYGRPEGAKIKGD